LKSSGFANHAINNGTKNLKNSFEHANANVTV
jgi:hypothetical protein